MKDSRILVIDDNKSILSAIELLLKGLCAQVVAIPGPQNLMDTLRKNNFDVILLDMNFSAGINSGNEGLYWLQQILAYDPKVSVVMITAYGDVELAVKAVRLGAIDFVLKPWDNEKLITTIQSAYLLNRSKKEVDKLKNKERSLIAELNRNENPVIGSSDAMLSVLRTVAKVAKTNANVLITGENGTGKEVIAREIHRVSDRANQVMVTVDLGAVTETLFESELFGHKKGAFTDAQTDRTGKIETASGGTLFLDEIGNLSLPLQAKLLSALQNRTITRVGENRPIPVDIRLICATNCDLTQLVSEGKFREDLLYRINTIHVEIPPLRERKKDIEELTDYFLKRYSKKYNREGLKISNEAFTKLVAYRWPGNVRELQHAIEKAVILSDQDTLLPSDFIFKNELQNDVSQMNGTLDDMEQALIRNAIDQCDGNMSAVASRLGITRQTLYNKIKKYGL
ncbi:MAG TPA: sigma-54 dependent transcriptional regulator [Prolixibacteraceae bacterium]|nr:sigma-54 dependent transcriptional regulator [Prolixibacteraceae bacterium]HPS13109.1 sigma-54 dependent transcriptional regulator [Prolixibacteraceae bacterium]